MEYRIERQDGNAEIVFSGAVTIDHINEMKRALADVMQDARQVTVDFSQADDADLSCLQTLCSAHRTAVSTDRELSLATTRSAAFMQAVESAGYVRHTGCKLGRTNTCLWVDKSRRVQ